MSISNPPALVLLLLLLVLTWIGWGAIGLHHKTGSISLLIRLLIVTLLVLALAGINLITYNNNLAVVFLVDRSDSISLTAQNEELAYLQKALFQMGPDDQAAIVVFGGDALVERGMSSSHELTAFTSKPVKSSTDLGAAIRLGMALYPAHTARRMVLLSDGVNTTGDAFLAANIAAANGIQIDTVKVGATPSREVLINSVEVPENLSLGDHFDMQINLQATQATTATIHISSDNQVVYEGRQLLKPGQQSFSLPMLANKTGFIKYQVQIDSEDDTYYQNNRMAAFTNVAGPPAVLVVSPPAGDVLPYSHAPRPDEAAQIIQALNKTDYTLQRMDPASLPSNLDDLAGYSAIILDDVPASQLTTSQMNAIQSYVRDLGGGLLVIGGETSYGVGGYYHTPLEKTLPVEMQIKDQMRRPTLSIVFIIDHSGSMEEVNNGAMKLEMAKEAVIRSIDLLYPTDRVGVITFDDAASWVVPVTELTNKRSIENMVAGIHGGGGTDILKAVQTMAKTFPQDTAKVKHVILLTDGGAESTGIPELVKQLKEQNNITFTTIGVGKDAADFLPLLSKVGGGRYYFTASPDSIPSIFTQETALLSRSYIIEHPFYPQQAAASPILTGIQTIPQLNGYVGTTARDNAQSILVSDMGDPILAGWQYGLGRAIAFTSDATGHWAQQWLGWDNFAKFWAQTVRDVLRDRASANLSLQVEPDGYQSRLTVNALDENGNYLNNYQFKAMLTSPGSQAAPVQDSPAQTIDLHQVAPGKYVADFSPDQPGVYLFGIMGTATDRQDVVSESAGWVMSYSPEYRFSDTGDTLGHLAALTHGTKGTLDGDVKEIFSHNLPAGVDSLPVWPWLVLLAAGLLPIDIALRRLTITPEEIKRLVRRCLARFKKMPSFPSREHSAVMNVLIQTKRQSLKTQDEKASALVWQEPQEKMDSFSTDNHTRTNQDLNPDLDQKRESQTPSNDPSDNGKSENQSQSSTTASLLAAKREHKKSRDKSE